MRFDDRLSTVLGLTAEAPRDRAVQWRQLVELVARGGGGSDPALLAKALERIATLRTEVPDAVRASAARAIASPDLPAGLLAIFAADRADIAAPLLAAVELDAAGWAEVRSGASSEVRALVDSISPPPQAGGDLQVRARPVAATASPGDPPERGIFRWECGSSGEIDWVEGAPRAALVGFSLARELRRPFADRVPFRDETLVAVNAGSAAGPWLWTGEPRFEAASGRFVGYAGAARREGATAARPDEGANAASIPPSLDSAALRELIHELRTPLTAIIGFGEIIEGQYLGPAHRAYRDRAGEIVRQARRLLSGVEELDLAAKLGSVSRDSSAGTPTGPLLDELERRLAPTLAERGAAMKIEVRRPTDRLALEAGVADRLVRRFAESVITASTEGEQLDLIADRTGSLISLSLSRPLASRELTEDQLLNPEALQGSDVLGLGFSLRLVRGLAAIAGGGLEVAAERFVLLLPAASTTNS